MPPRASETSHRSPTDIFLPVIVVALATLMAYLGSFRGAFVYDDKPSILQNPAVRTLSPWGTGLAAATAAALPTAGRPVVRESLALNYALGGVEPWGYHAVNVAIHVGAALALFGIVRRTLERTPRPFGPPLSKGEKVGAIPSGEGRHGAAGRGVLVALAAALFWALHPLQTESVTYVVQRAESLMGLFYLLTLYCFVRGTHPGPSGHPSQEGKRSEQSPLERGATAQPGGVWWLSLSVLCCLLGMGTKEVMVSAPLIVLLYDRAFVAGSFAQAWRSRRPYYLALAASWIPLACLVARTGDRGGTAGFGVPGLWRDYALLQLPAVVHYLRLALWPQPLVFDYGVEPGYGPAAIATAAVLIGLLLAAVALGLRRNTGWGFLGAAFFAVLAPSSSVVPITTETMAEHRMYLPLAALAAAAAAGAWAAAGRRGCLALLAVALAFGGFTWRRNADYRSELALWADTVAKRPGNARARYNYAGLLAEDGRRQEAEREYEAALRLKPAFPDALSNLANLKLEAGDAKDAELRAREALRLAPDLAEARATLGNALFRQGRLPEAVAEDAEAVRLAPGRTDLLANLGAAQAAAGDLAAAEASYREALRLDPAGAGLQFSLGNVLAREGRLEEAEARYAEAVRLQPGFVEAREHLERVRAFLKAAPAP